MISSSGNCLFIIIRLLFAIICSHHAQRLEEYDGLVDRPRVLDDRGSASSLMPMPWHRKVLNAWIACMDCAHLQL